MHKQTLLITVRTYTEYG